MGAWSSSLVSLSLNAIAWRFGFFCNVLVFYHAGALLYVYIWIGVVYIWILRGIATWVKLVITLVILEFSTCLGVNNH